MRGVLLAALALLLVAGCDDGSGACRRPAAADTIADGATTGCTPAPGVDACEVASDGSQRCHDLCKKSEYGLTCFHTTPTVGLGCYLAPRPMPPAAQAYCCPCTR